MLYLHVSNRTENLLLHLVQVLRSSGRQNPFDSEFFLIQSQGMERIISQTMADHFTSWCNFRFMLPMQFLTYCSEKLEQETTADVYERSVMLWRIEALLRTIDEDVYRQLHQYLAGMDAPLKRFQLAAQLANLFDQYQVLRPEMIASWQAGRTVTKEPAEQWQMALWQRLRKQCPDAPHRGELLTGVIGKLLDEQNLSTQLPARLNVFGLTTMVPLFLRFLQGLANHCQVHLYVLSPCSLYWGDIARRRGLDQSMEGHPLLVSMGQQGKDFQELLYSDVNYEQDFSSYQDPAEDGRTRLLTRLQSDLLKGEIEPCDSDWPDDDDSICIVSCHSKIRELGVLKNQILQWLYENPELELRDIIVMAPDIQEYSTLIPAVFSDVQHSIADRSLRRRNSIISAFSTFLGLFTGRFGWDELYDLLKEPAVAEKLQLTTGDLENIRNWVLGSGIRWGLSGVQKETAGLPSFEESTWKGGLERMLMGYAIDSSGFVDEIIPFGDIEGGNGAALGGLCRFISIIEQAVIDFGKSYDLGRWSELLIMYSDFLFTSDGDGSRDFLDLQEILAGLGNNVQELHNGEVDFTVIRAWLESVTRETRSSSGFLRGQLTFCSMLPMRSIPFKNVCLLGLNEGGFPGNDYRATFDLIGIGHRPGDRSRRMDDRYQFLETILAARDRLYLSYVGQSIKNNEQIPPSVVLAELLDVLAGSYKVKDLVVHHPLQPYSSKYFTGEDHTLFSYDADHCRVAEQIRQPPVVAQSWWRGRREVEIDAASWLDFQKFFRHPQEWFLRDCLGIRVRDEIAVVPESETFTHNTLEKYITDRELLEGRASGMNTSFLLKRLQAEGRWPLGSAGELLFEARKKELELFEEKIEQLQPGERLEPLPVDLAINSVHLHGMLTNLYEEGIFLYRHANLKPKDCLNGWLHHLLYSRITGQVVPTLVLGSDKHMVIDGESPLLPDLEQLMTVFTDGCREPSKLFLDLGFAALDSFEKGKGLQAGALAKLNNSIENGYDQELLFLLEGCDPADIFDDEFIELCHTVLEPVWRRCP